MSETNKKKGGWKQKIVHEAVEYYINFAYLAAVLIAFIWYRRLILAEYQIQYEEYWVPLVEAAVLAKVMMIGGLLRLNRGLEHKPLILPTLFRTVVFSVWVGLFSLLEKTVRGLLHGKGLMGGFEALASKGRYELLASCIVIFVAFIPFFAFRELGRVLGDGKIRALFFRSRVTASAENLEQPKEV